MSVKPSTYRAEPRSQPAPQRAAPSARGLWDTMRRLRWTEFRLLVIPALLSVVGILMVILVPTGAIQWQSIDIWMSFVFIELLYGIHIRLNITRPTADQVIFPIVCVVMALGLVMMQRLGPSLAAGSAAFKGIANKQVVWIIIGMLALLV